MGVLLTPELEKKLSDLAARTGRAPEQLIEDVIAASDVSKASVLDWSQCPVVESVPGKMNGAWVLKGTRMPVMAVFQNLEAGANLDDIVEWYDGLDREQIKTVIDFAARSLETPVTGR